MENTVNDSSIKKLKLADDIQIELTLGAIHDGHQ